MKAQTKSADEWWAELPVRGRRFLHYAAWLLELMWEDEVLEWRRYGAIWRPHVQAFSRRPGDPIVRPAFGQLPPEVWWAGVCPASKECFRELGPVIWGLKQGEVLTMTKKGSSEDGSLVVTARLTGAGRAEAN